MKYDFSTKIAAVKRNWLVRWTSIYLKKTYEKTSATNSLIKQQFLQFLPFLAASAITGFVAYCYSRLFSYAEHLSFFIFNWHNWLIFVTTPITFLFSWWLVKTIAPYSKGSGIPQVMAAVELTEPKSKHLIVRFLSLKVVLVKILSSTVKVIGGGVLGREGPTIQISSAIFNFIYKKLPGWWSNISQANVIIAGAASGLAAAFNTPLGGIIFAIEELSKFHIRHYKSPLFLAVIIAGLTAQGFGGSYLYLGYPKTNYEGSLFIVGIAIVCIICGYFGSKMCVYLFRFMRWISKFEERWKQIAIVLGCAFFVAGSIYIFGTDAMGSGKEIMERTLFTDNKTVAWYLPFVRMNGLIASFGMGGAGGIFAPSLSAGAGFGAVVADLLNLRAGNADLLILIGMTAFLTAVTRAPFTSAIIIFEMTDRHSIIFFLLIGAIIANVVASYVSKHSFYDLLKENYVKEVLEEDQRAKALVAEKN